MDFPQRKFESDLFIAKNGIAYPLPTGWALSKATDVDFNNKLTDKAFAHGSTLTGDGKIKGKTIEIEFTLEGATEEEHDAAMNLAYEKFCQSDYTLICGRIDRAFKVAAVSKVTGSYEKAFKQRRSNVKVALLLTNPFRYAVTPTIIDRTFTSEQDEAVITFYNPSSVDVPLIWSFTPPTGATAPNIAIYHKESQQSFIVADTQLTAPAVSVVNAESGTVRRDTGNSLNTFSGIFLHAVPGNNTFLYTGAALKMTITYTARWYV